MTAALDALPEPFLAVAPELGRARLPDEPLATCAACAMAPAGPDGDGPGPRFTAEARCCTYHPRLANFLVGRALRRGGPGAEAVRRRLQDPDGADLYGIAPSAGWQRALAERAADGFGNDPRFTCPYWVPGPRGCTIHPDRDAVCRTWHCRVAAGQRGQDVWAATNVLVGQLERDLARWCVAEVPPPEDGDLAAFYVQCADRADRLRPDEAAALRSEATERRIRRLFDAVQARDAPMPERLEPRLHTWARGVDGVVLTSFTPYDPVIAPVWVFELLSRLDGVRPWRQAVDETVAAGFPADAALVGLLWDRGLVG